MNNEDLINNYHIMSSLLGTARGVDNIKDCLDPDYFYEHGDNPAYKKFVDIVSANVYSGGGVPEFRSHVYDNRAR